MTNILKRIKLIKREEYNSIILENKILIVNNNELVQEIKEIQKNLLEVIEEKEEKLKFYKMQNEINCKVSEQCKEDLNIVKEKNKTLNARVGGLTKELNRCKIEYKHAISIIFKESKLDPDTRNYLSIRKNKITKEFIDRRKENAKNKMGI